ncbi:unnamed protein product [Allacma fusca]|uniref:Defensin n=1 Tax=Allacma fusca TaxID=39272 RepID=A0A8J2PNR2_9HEXA|nr:unnamed protein product [Allacma fusca]
MKRNIVVCLVVVMVAALCTDICLAGGGCPSDSSCARHCRENIRPSSGRFAGRRPCSGTCGDLFNLRCSCVYC